MGILIIALPIINLALLIYITAVQKHFHRKIIFRLCILCDIILLVFLIWFIFIFFSHQVKLNFVF